MQELKPAGVKRCYACIQWEGQRTYYTEKKEFKVDVRKEGNCLVQQKKVNGSGFCDKFFPLR